MPETRLDHLAVAVHRHDDAWPRYLGDLGARWVGCGETAGFRPAQVEFANGMRVEVLEPHRVGENDFLQRFLDHRGPGAHHLTYKVADLDEALEACDRFGYPVIGVDRSDPGWQEAFLHPKRAHGIVVQLAQSEGSWDPEPPPPGLPAPVPPAPARLLTLVHRVASLDQALVLFEDVLGGDRVAEGATGEGRGHRWVELTWPGPGRLRLVACDSGALGGSPGALGHVAFSVADPAAVTDAVAVDDTWWEVDPQDNLGVGLQLRKET